MKNARKAALVAALLFSGIFLTSTFGRSSRPQDERPRLAETAFPARADLLKKRIERLLPQAMHEHGVDCWIVVTRESSRDPIAEDLGGGSVGARSAFVFIVDKSSRLSATAIVANLDSEGPAGSGIYDRLVAYGTEGVSAHLRKIVHDAKPKRIALNYSRDQALADGLTAGMKDYLVEALGEDYARRFVSSEDMLLSFRGRMLPEELEVYSHAVELTQQILHSALSSRAITPGKTTERDIENFLRDRTRAVGAEVAFVSISVGTSATTSPIVRRGDLVRIDFGITWHGYKTDIQRTAYVLRESETSPAPFIKKMWETAVRANRAAVTAMRPGVSGVSIDAVARKIILSAGYIDYSHVTGHPVGVEVHDAGPVLGPDWKERYGSRVHRNLEAGQIFAVEPEVSKDQPGGKGEIGIGLEEEVIVEHGGARYLGQPQVELIIVR
jgi:Xaa-Pro dipeptidase